MALRERGHYEHYGRDAETLMDARLVGDDR